ncbi:MFS transporter [Virgibacillus siamensis]|uniref:MFS transporter n=1 Tax=Virgibacillus siamensis TaxID=480071 RepID=UPI0031DFB1A7
MKDGFISLLFSNSNFRNLFLGRLITNAGDSIYLVAAIWMVYQLGGSAFYTGLVGALTLLPQALQFMIGPLIDRWPLRKTMVTTQVLQFFLVLLIPVLFYFDLLTITVLLIIMPLISFIEEFAYPAQTVAIPKILENNQLTSGNTYMAFAYQGVDLVFNALAGILVTVFSATIIFLVDASTFIIAAFFFYLLKLPKMKDVKPVAEKQKLIHSFISYKTKLKEGIYYIKQSILAKCVIVLFLTNFSIGINIAVLPVYAGDRGGAYMYGFYMASLAAGTLAGSLLSNFFDRFPLGKLYAFSYFFTALFWIVSIIIPFNTLSVVAFGLAWIPIGVTSVVLISTLQRIVPEHFLARAFTVLESASAVAMPLGSFIGGTITVFFTANYVLAFAGIVFLLIAMLWLIITDLRLLPRPNVIDPEKYGLTYISTMMKNE